MAPYDVKMQYLGRCWTTVVLEVGHDEIGDTFDTHTTMLEEGMELFDFRKGHEWPPIVTENEGWDSLYKEAADGIPVLQTVSEPVTWSNDFVLRIVNS